MDCVADDTRPTPAPDVFSMITSNAVYGESKRRDQLFFPGSIFPYQVCTLRSLSYLLAPVHISYAPQIATHLSSPEYLLAGGTYRVLIRNLQAPLFLPAQQASPTSDSTRSAALILLNLFLMVEPSLHCQVCGNYDALALAPP